MTNDSRSTHERSATDDVAPDEPLTVEPAKTYDELVLWAAKGALLVLATKVGSVILLGQFYSAPVSVDFWSGIIPRLLFSTTQENFTTIVTLSSLVMAVAGLLFVAGRFVDSATESKQRLVGRSVASLIALQTIGLEIIRHLLVDETIRWWLAWIVIATGVAGIALVVVTVWNDFFRGVNETELQGSPTT